MLLDDKQVEENQNDNNDQGNITDEPTNSNKRNADFVWQLLEDLYYTM